MPRACSTRRASSSSTWTRCALPCVRSLLIDVLSCRENRSDGDFVARVASEVVRADNFLVNMGTDEFLSCLSRQALEAGCGYIRPAPSEGQGHPRGPGRYFKEGRLSARRRCLRPLRKADLLMKVDEAREQPEDDGTPEDQDELDGDAIVEPPQRLCRRP